MPSSANASYRKWLACEVYEVLLPELLKQARRSDEGDFTQWEVDILAEILRLEAVGATDAVAAAIVASFGSQWPWRTFLEALSSRQN